MQIQYCKSLSSYFFSIYLKAHLMFKALVSVLLKKVFNFQEIEFLARF